MCRAMRGPPGRAEDLRRYCVTQSPGGSRSPLWPGWVPGTYPRGMSPRSSSRILRPPQVLAMLLAFLLVSGVGGFLMAGMAVPFVTAAGTVANSTTGLFNELPTELEIDKPSEQSIMLAADGSVLATFYADNRIIVGYEDIAPSMRDAIVAIEDRRFYEHNGVDPEGMARAFVSNTFNNSTEGASTLTQQYVKNIFIERGRVTGDQEIIEEATEQTYGRKLQEARYAIARRDQVLADMLELGFITRGEYNEATALTIEEMLNPQTISSGCGSAGTAAYFCEYVVKELLNNESFGETVDDRRALLLRGGLVVETTLDPKHQKAAYDAVASTVPVNDSSNVKQAIVSVVPGTGAIRAIAQNTNYGTNAVPEDPTRTAVNFAVDRAHGGGEGFQTGSAFKALVLTQWLRTGHSLSDIVAGNKPSYPRDVWNISCAPENRPLEPYEPKNLEGSGGARVSVLEATRKSINLPFVEMASQMDLCGIADVAGAMGLKKGNGEPLLIVPSMALGSNTITPLDMASAFATFANDGVYCSPVAISRVTTREGEELAVPESECTRVLETEIARGMNYALQEVTKPGGTGSAAALPGRPIAGKTGTANMDYHAWFVGYTPQLAAAVWTGHNEGNVSMFDSVINGRYYRYVYGGVIAAPAWKKYMDVVMDGVPVEGFPSPNDKIIYGEKRAVPSVYGRSIASATEILQEAGFAVQVGGNIYSSYAYGTVAGMTPRPGAQLTAGSVIVLNPSAGPAPAPPPRPAPEPEPEPGPPDDDGDDDDDGRGGGNERVP